jgi:hypothetical protein
MTSFTDASVDERRIVVAPDDQIGHVSASGHRARIVGGNEPRIERHQKL